MQVIASDSKRNLYNQRFSPDQHWITFLAHDLLDASTSMVYVIPAAGGPWRAITEGRGLMTNRGGVPTDGSCTSCRIAPASRTSGAGGSITATGTPIGEPFPVTSFRSAQFVLTPRTVQMDIAITPTKLLLPMSESRSDLWMLDQIDR